MGMNTKHIGANMIFGGAAMALNLFINFFITPYITGHLGAEAYGFIKLANDFANYASLISIALNSMSSRFIMLERENGRLQAARRFYSSVTVANIVLAGVMVLPAAVCVALIDRIFDVPPGMAFQVRLTFAFVFSGFIAHLAFTTFENCYYLTNRLDLQAMSGMRSETVRVIVIIALFALFSPKMCYMALGEMVSTVYLIVINRRYHRRLVPDLAFDRASVDRATIRRVLHSGKWNSLTRLSQIFTNGLDLMITNMMIGAQQMGLLSVAQTVPNMIVTLNAAVAGAFGPNMMQIYARGTREEFRDAVMSAMRFMCLFTTVPLAVLITMGREFYMLWVPSQPAQLLNVLSVLIVINSCVTGPMQPLYQVFTIADKVHQSSKVMIVYGAASLAITCACLKLTDWGLYAVVGISLIGSLIVALCYHLPFAAIHIGQPWHTFFPPVIKNVISLTLACGVGLIVERTIPVGHSWAMLIAGAAITAAFAFAINAAIVLTRGERRRIASAVRRFLVKKK